MEQGAGVVAHAIENNIFGIEGASVRFWGGLGQDYPCWEHTVLCLWWLLQVCSKPNNVQQKGLFNWCIKRTCDQVTRHDKVKTGARSVQGRLLHILLRRTQQGLDSARSLWAIQFGVRNLDWGCTLTEFQAVLYDHDQSRTNLVVWFWRGIQRPNLHESKVSFGFREARYFEIKEQRIGIVSSIRRWVATSVH